MAPLDRFSNQAEQYAQFRITYPAELYEFLLEMALGRKAAWDCGTGNGQVAVDLAAHFSRVEATDISEKQLMYAAQRANVHYHVCAAEQPPFPDNTFDLITTAQALHWFDAAAFHREAQRVAKPGATIAEWAYGLVKIGEPLDALISRFYRDIVGPYWDEHRRHIDDSFARIPFPFAAVAHQNFETRQLWSAERFLQYLQTWSSVYLYQKKTGENPVDLIAQALRQLWGEDKRKVCFPIFLRAGLIAK
ncbi:class I SAM-dependent methyltransferase [Solirubrum puertoriconensis]|uniref:SAM-dependent methyltransferase n=1 Tax=Solirubrum puertoriconensis TaxID=1751427 RepID=A0A9X0HIF6_SOLP1|nr:class I SAM-dependent methyltransferase [Solirubrum puertoriconensis]KUG06463.1 SAM-dependent methyltransferase [Solirubrum puertoriconensis]